MNHLTTVLLGFGLAADAFVVSISSGIFIKHIKINKALKIALFFGAFQAIMPLIGWLCAVSFKASLSGIDHWIAFILLSCIGGKMIYESTKCDEEEKKFNPLDTYTLIGLAIATSIDALAVGVSFAFLQDSIIFAVANIGFITFCLCLLGVFIGNKCGNCFGNKVEIAGGAILIFIGSKILFEHLTSVKAMVSHFVS